MELKNYNKLIVKQKVEIIEAITSIETKNKYQILNENQEEILFVYEESNWFARIILKRLRALNLTFLNNDKSKFLEVKKKFAFFFPEFEIYENNILLGKVKTRFGISSKIEIFDENNQLIFYCKNKIMHPWTFNIFRNKTDETSIALISKKWTGLGKETFTDADNFIIDFNQINDEKNRKITLALAIIIDLFIFDNK